MSRGRSVARHGADAVTTMRTLDFFTDWGCARERMEIARDPLEHDPPEDALAAAGTVRHGRAFAAALFERHGLNWRDHVREELRAPNDAAPQYFSSQRSSCAECQQALAAEATP